MTNAFRGEFCNELGMVCKLWNSIICFWIYDHTAYAAILCSHINLILLKGAFKYYVIKEVGGWVGQMMMFDDKVGGWGRLNDDVIKKYTRKKKHFCLHSQKTRL